MFSSGNAHPVFCGAYDIVAYSRLCSVPRAGDKKQRLARKIRECAMSPGSEKAGGQDGWHEFVARRTQKCSQMRRPPCTPEFASNNRLKTL